MDHLLGRALERLILAERSEAVLDSTIKSPNVLGLGFGVMPTAPTKQKGSSLPSATARICPPWRCASGQFALTCPGLPRPKHKRFSMATCGAGHLALVCPFFPQFAHVGPLVVVAPGRGCWRSGAPPGRPGCDLPKGRPPMAKISSTFAVIIAAMSWLFTTSLLA